MKRITLAKTYSTTYQILTLCKEESPEQNSCNTIGKLKKMGFYVPVVLKQEQKVWMRLKNEDKVGFYMVGDLELIKKIG